MPLSNISEDHELYPVLKQVYDDLDRVEDAIASIGVLHQLGRVSLDIDTTQGKVSIPIGLEEFANLYTHGNTVNTTFSAAGTITTNNVKVTIYDRPGPRSGEIREDLTNSHILIKKRGIYAILMAGSIESVAGGGIKIGFHAKVNGTASSIDVIQNAHTERNLSGGGGDIGSVSVMGLWELERDDKLEMWCWNATNANAILISDISFSAILLKET